MKTLTILGILLSMILCSCNTESPKKNDTNAVKREKSEVPETPKEDVRTITQAPGVIFYDITLDKALKKAKEEGKYVLIDCYTQTCGPCRKMEKEIFPHEKLGDFVNERFVPIMCDMEKSEGRKIAEEYKVQIYPTMLVLLPNATKEGEIIGAELNIDSLIEMLKNIIHEK